MKMIGVARKILIEAWREPQLLGIYLAFPALMILMYFMAYGSGSQGIAIFLYLKVFNQDQGELGERFVQALQDARFDGKPVFTVERAATRLEGELALRERKAAMLVVIPPNFSQLASAGGMPASIELVGDPAADLFLFARSFVTGEIDAFSNRISGWDKPLPVAFEFVKGTGTMTDIQYGVPGVLVFGILFGVISTALVVVREERSGTLQRLRLSRASAADFLGGVLLAQLAETALQMPIAFGVALLFGFSSPGSLGTALLIGLLVSLAASGAGFLAGSFSHNDGEAATIGTLLMVPLVFFSGAIFPIAKIGSLVIAGREFSLFDLLPSTHASVAMRKVLVYGSGVGEILFELSALALLSAVLLAAGILVYQRKGLK